jgi:hypothetical protein
LQTNLENVLLWGLLEIRHNIYYWTRRCHCIWCHKTDLLAIKLGKYFIMRKLVKLTIRV